MTSKLGLSEERIERARASARRIAKIQDTFIRERSTVAVERTVLRLLGVDGVDELDIPLANVVVEAAQSHGVLEDGISSWIARAVAATERTPNEIARGLADGEIDFAAIPDLEAQKIEAVGDRLASQVVARIDATCERRDALIATSSERPEPLHYVIVATGNIYEDVVQARVAARQGADIVAVIRSTGQSLLDYVPYGATTEGFGGTYATQENFRIMREGLDEVGEELGRYIRICNYCSGLCMPEIAAMGALERLDVMLNDALYGILFRDINPERTFVDQYFSRMINARAGVVINTGEDNYLTTADAVEAANTVLASQFLNEQFARLSGLREEQMGLGHAMEMNPELENGFLMELAQAEMAREIFPRAPLKYMPPTKYMTGNIFRGHIQDALFNLIGVWTRQGIQLLGMMTEAMHTPHMGDRYLSLENARYVMNNARSLGDEIQYKTDGFIQTRAQSVLDEAISLLEGVEAESLFSALEEGRFADVKRPRDRGKGRDGVFLRSQTYTNPVETHLRAGLGLAK